MSKPKRTPFYDQHMALKAKMVDFSGWEMPLSYPKGIVEEHLITRKKAGLFDVSHMGRFIIRGKRALDFLQYSLSNNAEALDIINHGAQYTFIPNDTGGAVDDSYLYQFAQDEYLLVVNAANREKDWDHLQDIKKQCDQVELIDRTEELAMLSLQGPESRKILEGVIQSGNLPEPMRNTVSITTIAGSEVMISRTGYTGEPLCFEFFVNQEDGPKLWEALVSQGASPIGLGARDTLRLEAGMPLYGQELGLDPDGQEIPIFACPLAKIAVSFSPLKGQFIGRQQLAKQHEAFKRIIFRDYSSASDLPRIIRPIAVAGRGVARYGAKVFKDGQHIGYVTSGTMVPMWTIQGQGLHSLPSTNHQLRSIGLAYIDSRINDQDRVTLDIRGKSVDAAIVQYHMRSDAPPYARPIIFDHEIEEDRLPEDDRPTKALQLIKKSIENTTWRQKECINLIPSEMTISPMVRLLSVMDPSFRYAEHKKTPAFYDQEIFYYQGTEFIGQVEKTLEKEMSEFLGCKNVETRLISGQIANVAVFSAMVDYINRADRKVEPKRLRQVMNNHIGKGGHLSSQPMGALKDFVARDPSTERSAVINFPVLSENPHKIDVPATLKLIDQYRPELIVFGKSMVLHKEPVSDIRAFLQEQNIDAVIMYDMAHVLGLVGPHFQQPFEEGADLVTGSTHKTFFGTQRGVVGSCFEENEERYELWESLLRRTFPGSVSNHHLGTLLGLLLATYEMNYFKEDYQPQVIANAKAFARALKEAGLEVDGDPAIDFTETHQVVINVGYSHGPEIASKLEENNIICNYQANTDEEGFTASGSLRTGVSEMTRFGMKEDDFRALADLIQEVVKKDTKVKDKVKSFRQKFLDLQFCFQGEEYTSVMDQLHSLI